eukprot:4335903-Alexandrium_andersonii.AAC.1
MSASLVGSEMCIRDRHERARARSCGVRVRSSWESPVLCASGSWALQGRCWVGLGCWLCKGALRSIDTA